MVLIFTAQYLVSGVFETGSRLSWVSSLQAPNPPLIGHVYRPFIDAFVDVGAADHLPAAGADPHQLAIADAELFRILRVDLHKARLIGQVCSAAQLPVIERQE
ncbi:Uncharacterised protein [Leclercia adecarboxylata]|uniref:Uncharacterized protein n=1 Tax=Leclercia adecarboxylata TaxID=83655 RepID=A0A4U9IE41_9ENTR|nr:Uncharacterised protein [Leclercia adecarboxylata]